MSDSRSIARAVRVPSRLAPILVRIRIGWRQVAAVNCSSRVNSSCTARPVRSAAKATMSSHSISCLPPNPPPTRSQNTLTLSGGRSNSLASASRVRNGTCELVRTVSTPSSAIQASAPCVSRWPCCMRWVRYSASCTSSASAKPAAVSPISSCSAITRLRRGSAILAIAPFLSWITGASARNAASGVGTGGSGA